MAWEGAFLAVFLCSQSVYFMLQLLQSGAVEENELSKNVLSRESNAGDSLAEDNAALMRSSPRKTGICELSCLYKRPCEVFDQFSSMCRTTLHPQYTSLMTISVSAVLHSSINIESQRFSHYQSDIPVSYI